MSVRVQVILAEEEAARFKSQAAKEKKSLSAWLRDAGKKVLSISQQQSLKDPKSLQRFFKACREREKGVEPDWDDHKKLLLESYQAGKKL